MLTLLEVAKTIFSSSDVHKVVVIVILLKVSEGISTDPISEMRK